MNDRTPPRDDTSDAPETPADDVPLASHLDADELADEMSKESFPTSDPPSTWAGDARS